MLAQTFWRELRGGRKKGAQPASLKGITLKKKREGSVRFFLRLPRQARKEERGGRGSWDRSRREVLLSSPTNWKKGGGGFAAEWKVVVPKLLQLRGYFEKKKEERVK